MGTRAFVRRSQNGSAKPKNKINYGTGQRKKASFRTVRRKGEDGDEDPPSTHGSTARQ